MFQKGFSKILIIIVICVIIVAGVVIVYRHYNYQPPFQGIDIPSPSLADLEIKLPEGISLENITEISMNSYMPKELVVYGSDANSLIDMAHCMLECQIPAPIIYVFQYKDNNWQVVLELTSENFSHPESYIQNVYSLTSPLGQEYALVVYAVGGSRPGNHWFVLANKQGVFKQINPPAEYDDYASWNNEVSIDNNQIKDTQQIYRIDDSNQAPSGGQYVIYSQYNGQVIEIIKVDTLKFE